MPDSVDAAPSVANLVKEADFYLGNGLERMLRPESENGERDEEVSREAACRPSFASTPGKLYFAVVRRLVRSGLFRLLPAAKMKETVGVFIRPGEGLQLRKGDSSHPLPAC